MWPQQEGAVTTLKESLITSQSEKEGDHKKKEKMIDVSMEKA